MKTIKGRPTKKAISDLVDKHDLIIHHLDSYTSLGQIAWGFRRDAEEKANKVAAELTAHGFEYDLQHANPAHARAGVLRIKPKEKS